MEHSKLVSDLKKLLVDFLEQEQDAKDAGNTLHLNGLQYARVNLEVTLERNGIPRTSTINSTIEHN